MKAKSDSNQSVASAAAAASLAVKASAPSMTDAPQEKWSPQPAVATVAGKGVVSTAPGRGINPVLSWKRHKGLALAIFVIVLGAGAPVAWMMGKPAFYTEAAIRVSSRFLKNLNSDQELELQSNSQYREFVQQQIYTINRFDIVSEALQRLGDKRRLYQLPAENDRRATERLARELSIKPVPDSYLITIGLEGSKAEGLADVVNSVVTTYLEHAKTEELYGADQRRENLNQERDRLRQELKTLFDRRTALGQEIGVTTFSGTLLNPYDQLLFKSKDALENARRERIQAEAKLNALEKKLEANDRPAVEALAEEQAGKDAGLNSLKSNLYIRRSLLLSKLSGISKEHPGRPAIERELNDIEEEIARATGTLSKSYRSIYLDQRRAELAQTQRVERELDAQVTALGEKASWFITRYYEAVSLSEDIDRLQKRLATMDERVDFFSLESTAPGWVRVVSEARVPDLPIKGGKKKLLALVMLAAISLAAVAPIAVDLLDPRIHVAGQLQKLLGFPPVAWILDQRDEQTKQFAQDQLLRLATRLNQDRLAQGTRVIAFTSTKNGEGSSTLVLETARFLAKLGVQAVAVEANPLTPDKRYQSRGANKEGLIEVLTDQTTVRKAVLAGDETLPDRLAVGEISAQRPLATLDQYRQALRQLAEQYEFVLLDCAPLLLSVDAELLIGLADATLLVVEAGALSKGEIKRALQALERLAPPTFGAILNRVQLVEAGGAFAEQLQEYKTGKRLPARKLLSPWLWK